MKILFYGKRHGDHVNRALNFIKSNADVSCFLGVRGDEFPTDGGWFNYDLIISYLSPWIIPDWILKRADDAINFHPGSSHYPGIGCTNQCLYQGYKNYGVVCHRMLPKVDTGDILFERNFSVYDSDTVWSLTQRAYDHMLSLFYSVMDIVFSGKPIDPIGQWKRKPYTRRELNGLCLITPDMGYSEVIRRIRATEYPNYPGAYTEVSGVAFKYVE